jgi:hypothetical protein
VWLTLEGRHDGRFVGGIALHELCLREAGEDALGPLPGESRRERGAQLPGRGHTGLAGRGKTSGGAATKLSER